MFRQTRSFLRLFNLKKHVETYRNLQTSSMRRGGAPVEHKETKSSNWLFVSEHPDAHQGYFYRKAGNLQGAKQTNLAKCMLIFTWWFIFYNVWHNPDAFLGHMSYPDTSKWTNAELGIPDDDDE
jgi:hypothetical protein